MSTGIVAAALFLAPALDNTALDTLFAAQRHDIATQIRLDTCNELRARSALFFAEDGELERLLTPTVPPGTGLALR